MVMKDHNLPKSIVSLARKWDEEEFLKLPDSEAQVPLGSLKYYSGICEQIKILSRFRFTPYLNDEIQDFPHKLERWIEQFDTEKEKKLALLVASKITFVTEEQFRQLQEVCFQEKLRFLLLNRIISENGLQCYDYDSASSYFDSKLEQCLFAPLTDSARINQFFHVNKLDDHSRLALRSLDIFVHPELMKRSDIVEPLNVYYKDKPILIILEDYCGSGKTISSDLLRIIRLYPCFSTIIFCPYMITEWAERALYRIVRKRAPEIEFRIIYGMRLSEKMRCFFKTSALFSENEQVELKILCKKYHQRYFAEHRFIGKPKAFPFGYRNLQLLLVTQSNCPNHTLPIIWCTDKGWFPLFQRVQRYA